MTPRTRQARSRRPRRKRAWLLARLKAVAALVTGYIAVGLAYVLLDDNARAIVIELIPAWGRNLALLLTPIGIAWAVERTRNRMPSSE